MGLEEEQTGRRLNKISKYLTGIFLALPEASPPSRIHNLQEVTGYCNHFDFDRSAKDFFSDLSQASCIVNILCHEYIKKHIELASMATELWLRIRLR